MQDMFYNLYNVCSNLQKNQFDSHIFITSLILFQSQSPLSLLFEIDMDKLTEHQTMKVMFMVDMIVFNTRLSLRVVDWIFGDK